MASVLADIPQDVRPLQRVSEVNGVVFAGWITATENADRDEAHRTGHVPAIFFKFREGGVMAGLNIHGATAHHGLE